MRDESVAMKHPETGLLAAFANHALTAQERASLLVHLGECARCRDIVFLAQRSVLASEPEKSFTPGLWRKSSNFTLVTSGLAACLLVVGTIARVHYHSDRSHGAETAALRPLPAPVVASPPATARPLESTHSKPPLPVPAKIAPGASSIPPVWADSNTGISMPQTSVREPDEQPIQRAKPISPEQAEAQRKMWLREQADEQALIQKIEHANSSTQTPSSPVSEPVVSDSQAESSTAQVNGATALPDNASKGSAPVVTIQPQAPTTEPALHLPSGLAVSSRIEIEGRILVLDTAGALFTSGDRGRHWRRIKTPWIGRAYELVGFPPMVDTAAGGTEAQSGTAARPGKAPAASGYHVAMAFCADGERWMSLDRGETWKPASPNR